MAHRATACSTACTLCCTVWDFYLTLYWLLSTESRIPDRVYRGCLIAGNGAWRYGRLQLWLLLLTHMPDMSCRAVGAGRTRRDQPHDQSPRSRGTERQLRVAKNRIARAGRRSRERANPLRRRVPKGLAAVFRSAATHTGGQHLKSPALRRSSPPASNPPPACTNQVRLLLMVLRAPLRYNRFIAYSLASLPACSQHSQGRRLVRRAVLTGCSD